MTRAVSTLNTVLLCFLRRRVTSYNDRSVAWLSARLTKIRRANSVIGIRFAAAAGIFVGIFACRPILGHLILLSSTRGDKEAGA